MDFQIISLIVTVIVGVVSVVLAGFAIWIARSSEHESRANFEHTQSTMRDYYDKTKDVLAEIDKRSAVTEKTVTDSQKQLLDTVTNILNETVVPTKPDWGEQMAAQFLQKVMTDPDSATEMMSVIQKIGEMPVLQQTPEPSRLPKSNRTTGRRKT